MYEIKESQDTNEVYLVGEIINLFFTDGSINGNAIITLSCGGKTYPKIFAPAGTLGDKASALRIGTVIEACCNIQHSNRTDANKTAAKRTYGIWLNYLNVYYRYEEPIPLFSKVFYASGRIVRVKVKDNVSTIYLRTFTNNRVSTFPVTIFNPRWQLKKGDHFQCCGTIQTWRKERADGTFSYYESYVAKSYM